MTSTQRSPGAAASEMNSTSEPAGDTPGMHEASRREKLRKIQELGLDPWGGRIDDLLMVGDVRALEEQITVEPIPPGSDQREPKQHGPKVRAAGRIVLQRKKGKLIFLDIRDSSGQI